MSSRLLCLGLCALLWWLAPPTSTFSHGASHASCQDMSPGHIRAQPQDPRTAHITLRTSHSSYLPGQLLTVTVRSSRDFMGFLLQARSGGSSRAPSVSGAKPRTGSTRLGPILMGGAWTHAPPGTHTLHCLSEGDTLTHSDKQLKRNLSFVWRAPDVAMGDVRFYITVVQSYFVYWAGIGSAVVRDGSRQPWSGLNTTGVYRETTSGPSLDPETLNRTTSSPPPLLHPFASLSDGRSHELENELDSNMPTALTPRTSVANPIAPTALQPLQPKNQDLPHQGNQSQLGIQALTSEPLQPRTVSSSQWRTSQPSVTPTLLHLLQTALTPNEDQDLPAKTRTVGPVGASPPDITEQPHVTTLGPLATSPSFTTLGDPPSGSSPVSQQWSLRTTLFIDSIFSSARIQPKTPPVLYTLPPANPISTPPQTSHVGHSSDVSVTRSHSTTSHPGSSSSELFIAPVLVPTSIWGSPQQSTTISPNLLSPTSSASGSDTSHSKDSSSLQPTPPPPGPSPAPRQSLYGPLTSSIPPFPSQTPTGRPIQTQPTLKDQEMDHIPSTPKKRVHPNPRPHPNSEIKTGQEFKPPKTETKRPTSPAETPEREDIVPRRRAWELVMLLACSAGLGMLVVVGVRHLYRQACGKHTRVTLSDRERDHGRGLIHVQECGDLVRVRRIRENSFVLLAEYDILAAPGD